MIYQLIAQARKGAFHSGSPSGGRQPQEHLTWAVTVKGVFLFVRYYATIR